MKYKDKYKKKIQVQKEDTKTNTEIEYKESTKKVQTKYKKKIQIQRQIKNWRRSRGENIFSKQQIMILSDQF